MATKPIFATDQIVNAITTSWSDGDTDPRSWDTHNLTIWIGSVETTAVPPDGDNDEQNGYVENCDLITMLHEIGHALRLSHPGVFNADDKTPPTYLKNAAFAHALVKRRMIRRKIVGKGSFEIVNASLAQTAASICGH